MTHKKKLPISIYNPSGEKEPRVAPDIKRLERENLGWHFRVIDKDGPFGWRNIDRETIWCVIGKLAAFETMTWGEVLGPRNHEIPRSELCPMARVRLGQIKQNDIDQLVSLHLDGKRIIWGIRDRRYMKILWWDPEHQVCPSAKKHT